MSDSAQGEDSSADDARYGLALCGAKRSGRSSSGPGRCRHIAGWGTEHVGIGRCKLHGGATRNHRIAAVKQEVERRMVNYGEPIDLDPATALLLEVNRTAGHVAWLGAEVRDHADVTSHEGRVLVELYRREREHMVRVAKAALDAGVAEREVRLAEAQAAVMAAAILGVLHDLSLTVRQLRVAKKLVGSRLREISQAPAA